MRLYLQDCIGSGDPVCLDVCSETCVVGDLRLAAAEATGLRADALQLWVEGLGEVGGGDDTPLHETVLVPDSAVCVALTQKEGAVRELLGCGVDVREESGCGSGGSDALDAHILKAAQSGDEGTLALLHRAGVDLNRRLCDPSAYPPLLAAAHCGKAACVRFMLRTLGLDVRVCGGDGFTAAMCAARNGDVPCLDAICEGAAPASIGAVVNAKDGAGRTPLMLAVEATKLAMVERLISLGADVAHTDKQGQGLLHCAVRASDGVGGPAVAVSLLQLLASQGVSACPDEHGRLPLHLAAQRGDVDVGRALLRLFEDSGSDAGDKRGETPAMLACQAGSLPFLELLRCCGADFRQRDLNGWCVVFYACQKADACLLAYLSTPALRVLCNPVDSTDVAGWTPLHLAAQSGSVEVATLLLELGVDRSMRDLDGFTPCAISLHNENYAVSSLLHTPCALRGYSYAG